ncbi:uncharacterized protein N7469_005430 [Penicillium citrinum]|uniref:Uncharacterized protein n=1 Tax=Penicillium citrinum TaxID=5077 RepID=A0A9W9TQU2_PENCI|nr:uncharacterized protein N7469_005430 [Penicillium citrinum]KAJ5233664.1 hypothetical protein N7469_005430 [Penicillium citrinum]KAK5790332.1 hypothetical protein VI817_007619 [Penicillium citrinum]
MALLGHRLSITSLFSQSSEETDDTNYSTEPRRWWIVFEFKEKDRRLPDFRLLHRMLANIKKREDVFVTDFDPTGLIPLSYIFDIVTMTNTDDDILGEAEIVIDNWIMDYYVTGPPFQREKVFGKPGSTVPRTEY